MDKDIGKGSEREEETACPSGASQASATVDSFESQEDSSTNQPLRKSGGKRGPSPSPLSPSPPEERIGKRRKKGQPKRDDEGEEESQPAQAEEEGDEEEEKYYSDSSSLVSEDPPFPVERAGIYAPLFRFRQKRQTDCIPIVRLPPRVVGGVRDQLEKTKVCNCKRSNCLKLYCDCFMAGLYCTGVCNCVSCKNNQDHPRQRNVAIDVTLMRNANAFRPQLQRTRQSSLNKTTSSGSTIQSPTVTTREKACHCVKSFCLKKYCECFLARAYCSSICQCQGCKNKVGNPERERLLRKRHAKEQSETVAAALAHQHTRAGGHHGDQHQQQEMEVGSVSAAGAEAVQGGGNCLVGGMDLLLPPSTYAVPMTMNGGRVYPALAFTTAGYRQGTLSSPQDNIKSQAERVDKPTSSPKSPTASTALDDNMYKHETQLEKLWRIETERAGLTFTKMYRDLAVLATAGHHDDRIGSTNNRLEQMTDYRARMTMNGVMADVRDIAKAMHRAGANAMGHFVPLSEEDVTASETPKSSPTTKKADPQLPLTCHETTATDKRPLLDTDETLLLRDVTIDKVKNSDVDVAVDQSPSEGEETVDRSASLLLMCDETFESWEDRELTEDAVRELTVLASQEAAVLRQLAGILRRKTLEMTKRRLKLVEDARRNALAL